MDLDGDTTNNDQDDDIDGDGVFNWLDDDMDSDGLNNDIDTDNNSDAMPDAPPLDMTHRDINDPWQNINLGQKIYTYMESSAVLNASNSFGGFGGNWLLNTRPDNIYFYGDAGHKTTFEETSSNTTCRSYNPDNSLIKQMGTTSDYVYTGYGYMFSETISYVITVTYKNFTYYFYFVGVDDQFIADSGNAECVGITFKRPDNSIETLGSTNLDPNLSEPSGY